MSVFDNGDGTLKLREQPIYAASRIGVYFKQGNNYQYELSDHLGTVRAVINRTKLSNGQADVVYYADYYPYGQVLRSAGTGWRYGYQGQYAEKDGETGWNAFEARNYDAAIGRWLSTDPAGQYHSPYVGMGNNPVIGVDPDGQWSWLGAFFRRAGSFLRGQGPSKLYKSGDEWGFNTTDGNGVISGRFRGEGDLVKEFVSGIPVVGYGLRSGDRLNEGDYSGATADFLNGTAEALTLGYGSRIVGLGINLFDRLLARSAAEEISAEGAVWAQKTFSGVFSVDGKFAGQTIEGVVDMLKNGTLSANDVTINVVVRNGRTFILNTRSSVALMQAGIPRSAWNVVNQTGVFSFENMLTGQLGRNGLINGTNTIRQSGTQIILSH